MFKLSQRSLDRLEGVDPRLQDVVMLAITKTEVDFGVICGMRTIEEQRLLVEKGASQTLKSRHLEGKAVDLMAYIGPRASWEISVYDEVADSIAASAKELGVDGVVWGAAWTVPDIADFDGTMEHAMLSYVDTRRSQARRPFIDGPHFQLSD